MDALYSVDISAKMWTIMLVLLESQFDLHNTASLATSPNHHSLLFCSLCAFVRSTEARSKQGQARAEGYRRKQTGAVDCLLLLLSVAKHL